MYIPYTEWYEFEYQQKLLTKLSDAYDVLDFNGAMELQFDKEDFIDDIMENRYDFEMSEIARWKTHSQ